MRCSLKSSARLALVAAASSCCLGGLMTACGETSPTASPERAPIEPGSTWQASDTLLAMPSDEDPDAEACLLGLCWPPAEFPVRVEAPWRENCGDYCVRFPSPRPAGHAGNDAVAMEWYAVRDEQGKPRRAPACIVVHESGRGMDVGRLIARGLHAHGLHTFMVHLPWYGQRQPATGKPTMEMVLPALSQGIADVRRARDAVAALPVVETDTIAVQGTSLGGFVTATAASLDRGFHSTFILLAGGDLAGIIEHGAKDAAKFRDELKQAGLSDEQVAEALHGVEPLRVAHRLDPARTWLYSGKFDQVVPPKHCKLLATAAGLADDHHLQLHATHYSGMIYLPVVLAQIHTHITAE